MIQARVISVNTKDPRIVESLDKRGASDSYHARREYTEYIVDTFDNKKFKLDIFDAVTPNDFVMHNTYIEYQGNEHPIKTDSKYVVANFLSHWEIWHLDEDTLIFEDDVEWKSIDWDAVYFAIKKFEEISFAKKVLYLQGTVPWNMQPRMMRGAGFDKYFKIPLVNEDLSGTAAYFVDKRAKEVLLNVNEALFNTDGYLHMLHRKSKIFYFYPIKNESIINLNKAMA